MTHSITIQSVALASALRLTTEAIKHAQSRNWKIAVFVVDSAGATVASARMDGVNAITGDIALDKAYTAASLRRTTKALAERMHQMGFINEISPDPMAAALAVAERIATLSPRALEATKLVLNAANGEGTAAARPGSTAPKADRASRRCYGSYRAVCCRNAA